MAVFPKYIIPVFLRSTFVVPESIKDLINTFPKPPPPNTAITYFFFTRVFHRLRRYDPRAGSGVFIIYAGWVGLGRVGSRSVRTSRVGSGRVKKCSKCHGSGRVIFESDDISRVGSGHI